MTHMYLFLSVREDTVLCRETETAVQAMWFQQFGTVVETGHSGEKKATTVRICVGTHYNHSGLLLCNFRKIHCKEDNSTINVSQGPRVNLKADSYFTQRKTTK